MAGLDDDTLIQLLQMTAESMEVDPQDVEITDALEDEVEAYETALQDALEVVAMGFPRGSKITAEDLWDAEASYLVLMTLRGEGVGIWDGSWDDFFDEREIKEVEKLLKSRLHSFADDSGGGSLNEALMNAVSETAGEPEDEDEEDEDEDEEVEDLEPNKKMPLRRNEPESNHSYERAAIQAIRLAQANEHKGDMSSSAQAAAADAEKLFNRGDYEHAYKRALVSLSYSVGLFSYEYRSAKGAYSDNGSYDDNAKWTRAYMNRLPDDAFLYVDKECVEVRDAQGRSHPLECRYFPFKNQAGNVDLPHLRNALARIPVTRLPSDVKSKVRDKAERLLSAEGGYERTEGVPTELAANATYKAAAIQHLDTLRSMGWRTQPGLKVPWALSPDGDVKLWFRPQAVYVGHSRPSLSLHVDMRSAPTEALITEATEMYQTPDLVRE